jgi:hypothetical protein
MARPAAARPTAIPSCVMKKSVAQSVGFDKFFPTANTGH